MFKTLPGMISLLYVVFVLAFFFLSLKTLVGSLYFGQQDMEALNWVLYGVLLGFANSLMVLLLIGIVAHRKDTIMRKERLLKQILVFLLAGCALYFVLSLSIVSLYAPQVWLDAMCAGCVMLLPFVLAFYYLRML